MGIPTGADRIEQVAFGFMASKVLFSAIDFELFTQLAKGPLDAEELRNRLGIHRRSIRDFLDALVALGMLERRGEVYSNILGKPTSIWTARNPPTSGTSSSYGTCVAIRFGAH